MQLTSVTEMRRGIEDNQNPHFQGCCDYEGIEQRESEIEISE